MKRGIKIGPGYSLEETVNTLLSAKEKGQSVWCEFNGHKLYSDNVSMDLAYLEVLGMKRSEYEKRMYGKWQKLEE